MNMGVDAMRHKNWGIYTRRIQVARGRGMDWLVCNGCEDGCASDGGKTSFVRRKHDDAGIFAWRQKYTLHAPQHACFRAVSKIYEPGHISVLSQISHIHSPSLPIPLTLLSQTCRTPESSWSAYLQLKQEHPTAFNSKKLSGSFIPEIHHSRIYHGNGQRWTVGVDLTRIEGDKKAESSIKALWIWRRVGSKIQQSLYSRCSYYNIPFSTTPIC